MKFLISNYSSHWFTEPYYFAAGLGLIKEEAHIFNHQKSVYDNFDKVKPNIFITHANHINKDIVSYLKENNDIQTVININEIEIEKIKQLNELLQNQNIPALFIGSVDVLENIKYIKLIQSADIFLPKQKPEYNIDKLIFVEQESDIVDLDGTYHYSSTNTELFDKIDFAFPLNILTTLFNNYHEIVFKGSSYIGSQLSFNAIYSGTKVVFDTKESSNLDKIDNIFKGQKLLSSVKNKHTCLHRLKSLLSSLSLVELSKKLEIEIDKL